MQSRSDRPLSAQQDAPGHVAIIMDGNGRWASRRSWPRIAGHQRGARAVRRIVESAPGEGIRALTLYAFSSDNWHRPPEEVNALMGLFLRYLKSECKRCIDNGVRLEILGRRDRFSPRLLRAIRHAERVTGPGDVLTLRLAVDYSARDTILRAACEMATNPGSRPESFPEILARVNHARDPVPPVDLLIRTGGEQRLSDFLLWECAYAELYFTPKMWPDFGPDDLKIAVQHYQQRERRFGQLGTTPEPLERSSGIPS